MSLKPAAAVIVTASILLAASDCSQIVTAVADFEPTVQTLDVPVNPLLTPSFSRGTYEIITVSPWLNPDNKNIKLSNSELTSILKLAGFQGDGLRMALAIAFYESTNRPFALNKSSNCYGLFQINMTGAMGTDRRSKYNLQKNEDLFDALTNATVAYLMSDGGKDWSAWSTEEMALASIN